MSIWVCAGCTVLLPDRKTEVGQTGQGVWPVGKQALLEKWHYIEEIKTKIAVLEDVFGPLKVFLLNTWKRLIDMLYCSLVLAPW